MAYHELHIRSRIDLDKKCSFENMKPQKASGEKNYWERQPTFFLMFYGMRSFWVLERRIWTRNWL